MAERELVLVGEATRARAAATSSFTRSRPSASRTSRGALPLSSATAPDPEDASDDGRVLQDGLLVLGQAVQARCDQPVDRTRELDVVDGPRDLPPRGLGRPEHAVVDQLADDLLDVERVALAPLDDRRASARREARRGAGRRASPRPRPPRAGRGRSTPRCACRRPTSGASRTARARAVATTRIGPCAQSATCSTKSSSPSSAQWMSSSTSDERVARGHPLEEPAPRLEQVLAADRSGLAGADQRADLRRDLLVAEQLRGRRRRPSSRRPRRRRPRRSRTAP